MGEFAYSVIFSKNFDLFNVANAKGCISMSSKINKIQLSRSQAEIVNVLASFS